MYFYMLRGYSMLCLVHIVDTAVGASWSSLEHG